jgi:hypothetical protein
VAFTLLAVVGLVLLGTRLGYRDIDVWGTLVLPAILFAVVAPIVAAIERRQAEPLVGLVVGALAARLVGAMVRYLVSFHVYEGADPQTYHLAAIEIARQFWHGDLTLWQLIPRGSSTEFTKQLAGLVETFTGQSKVGAFMVFTVFSYIGAVLMLTAARIAVPGLMTRRYALLVLFLPSMLYWPSSLGKDGPMQLGIGLAAYGAARIFTGSAGGWLWGAAGVYLAGQIRPHVAVLLVGAVTLAFVAGGRQGGTGLGPVPRILGGVLLVGGMTVALGAMSAKFGEFSAADPLSSTTALLEKTGAQTSQGGSAVDVATPNSPLAYPYAAFTVLFRPLLFEADSASTAASALEGTALLVLAWLRRSDLRHGIATARANRYLVFLLVYSVTFALAWSSVGNLGIIARQRCMMLPLLAVLVCVASSPGPRRKLVVT